MKLWDQPGFASDEASNQINLAVATFAPTASWLHSDPLHLLPSVYLFWCKSLCRAIYWGQHSNEVYKEHLYTPWCGQQHNTPLHVSWRLCLFPKWYPLFIYLFIYLSIYLIFYVFVLDLRPKLSSMSISAKGNTFRFVDEVGLFFLPKPQALVNETNMWCIKLSTVWNTYTLTGTDVVSFGAFLPTYVIHVFPGMEPTKAAVIFPFNRLL